MNINQPQSESFVKGKGIWVLVGVLLVVAVIFGMTYVSYANQGNRMEKAMEATYSNNKNLLGTCTNKILEIAQIPGMYRDDLVKVINAEMQGRYSGEKGKVANFVKERAMNFDSSLYTRIQNEMVACGNRFENAQSTLIDQKRAYKTALDDVVGGFWLGVAGYPKVDINKYNIVLAEDTEAVFEAGKRAPIKIPRD